MAAEAELTRWRSLGVSVRVIGADELTGLEPGLPPLAAAALVPEAIFLTDPDAMMRALAASVTSRAQLIRARATSLARHAGGVQLDGPGFRLTGTPRGDRGRRVFAPAGGHCR